MQEKTPTETRTWRLVVTVIAAVGVHVVFFGVAYGVKWLQVRGPVLFDDTCFGGLGIVYLVFLILIWVHETEPAKWPRWQRTVNALAIVPFVASAFVAGQVMTGESWYNQLSPWLSFWLTWAWLLVGTTVVARKLWNVQGYGG